MPKSLNFYGISSDTQAKIYDRKKRKAKPNTKTNTKPITNANTNTKQRETAGEKSGIVVILILVPLMQLMKEDSVWLMERLQTSR